MHEFKFWLNLQEGLALKGGFKGSWFQVVSVNNLNNFFKVMRLIFGKIEAHKVY